MALASQRRTGLILGLVIGLAFSVTTNLINSFILPEIPLSAPWPGRTWLIVLSTSMFGVLGLIAGWTEETLPGVFASALVGTLIASTWVIITQSSDRGGAFLILFLTFLSRIFYYLPFSILVRWLIKKLYERPYGRDIAPARRLVPVLLSVLAVIFIGTWTRVTEEEKKSFVKMQELIKTGQAVSKRDDLPLPLQAVNGFIENGKGPYTFSLGPNPDALPVQRPTVEYGAPEPFVIVRYENGFRFGCVFSPPYLVPACIDY